MDRSLVLLQNNRSGAAGKPLLPLSLRNNASIAMIGPNANAKMNLLSGYHGDPPLLVSPLAAMRSAAGGRAVNYA